MRACDVGQPRLQVETDREHARMMKQLNMNENQKAALWPVPSSTRGLAQAPLQKELEEARAELKSQKAVSVKGKQ